MSIEAMSHALNLNVGDSTRKLVLIGYANHADKGGRNAFPSTATVAEYACCSVRTVQRHLSALLAEGYLREGDQALVEKYPHYARPIVYDVAMTDDERDDWATEAQAAGGPGGVRAASRAHGAKGVEAKAKAPAVDASSAEVQGAVPIVAPGDNLTPPPGDNLSPGQDGLPGDTDVTPPVTPVTRPGDTDVTQTVLEPSLEPSKDLHVEADASPRDEAADAEALPVEGLPQPDHTRLDVERVCKHLADRIEGNGSKRPTITKRWRDAARLLMDLDGVTEDRVHRAIDWCQDDEFWRANVLSMPTLRERYDQLRLQAQRQATGRPRPQAYNDEATWGSREERAAAAQANAQRSEEEIDAEIEDLFRDTRPRSSAHGG